MIYAKGVYLKKVVNNSPFASNMKKFFAIIFISLSLFLSSVSFASDTCVENVDCMESINENTSDILNKIDDFNSNFTDVMQVLGVYMGLSLFSSAFVIGQFFYKK